MEREPWDRTSSRKKRKGPPDFAFFVTWRPSEKAAVRKPVEEPPPRTELGRTCF